MLNTLNWISTSVLHQINIKMTALDYDVVIIDNGSSRIKAGCAGNDEPYAVFPSVVGEELLDTSKDANNNKHFYMGHQALDNRDILSLRSPFQDGFVSNWGDMERILYELFFYRLRRLPAEDGPVLITEPPFNPKADREKMAEILFEGFDAVGFYTTTPAVLSLYATGRTTGIVLDSGDAFTHAVPIYEGHILPHAIERIDGGGKDLTKRLIQSLQDRAYDLTAHRECDIAQAIKEKLCYVASDYKEELNKPESTFEETYQLPDGQIISISEERFKIPELLFQTSIHGDGIHEMVQSAIMKCDENIRSSLYENIILSGGTSMLPGLPDRFTKEMETIAPCPEKVKVIAPPDRKSSAWLGGSMMCSLPSFENCWILKEEFSEWGAAIVHRKCF